MRSRSITAITFALVTFVASLSTANGQDETDVHTSVRRLLSNAWGVTPTARAIADEIYASRPLDQPAVTQAYALTLIKQRRYPEALQATRSLLSVEKDDPRLRWSEIWLLLVSRKYDAALERTRSLAALAESTATGESIPLEILERLGTAVGFLEGPARASITDAVLNQQIAKVVSHMNKEQLESYRRGRKNLLDDFTLREQESRLADQEEREAIQRERQTEQAQVDQERQRLADEAKQLDQKLQQFEDEIRENSSQLRKRETDARAAALKLADQAAFMRSRLLLLDADLARLDLQIAEATDPAVRAILVAQYNNVVRVHRLQVNDLRNVDVRLTAANQNLAIARNDRAQLERHVITSRAAFNNSQRELNKAIVRINRRRSDLAVPEKKASVRSRAQRKKTAAWITYLPYPLEAERQRLLQAIKR